MKSFGATRQNYYTSNTIPASYSIIAEWNMNDYFYASHSGTYIGKSTDYGSVYSTSDAKILKGNNLLIFEDDDVDAIMDDPTNEWMTSISSIFQPRRPDPNILLLQFNQNSKMLSPEWFEYAKRGGYSTACPRYYACTDSYNSYDYWISSKAYSASTYYNEDISKGVSGVSGSIELSKPFIRYNASFPCNKIVIKTQTHLGVPSNFKVDILTAASPTTWTNIYTVTSSTAMSNGILKIYRQSSGNWSTAEKFATDVPTIASATQTDIIVGLRFWVNNMSQTQIPLEVIEVSPRLVIDVTSLTKSMSISQNMGESEFGLPVGNIVTTSGDIELFNENSEFLSTGVMASYGLIKPNVKFTVAQVLDGIKYQIKELYANSWDVTSDFSVSVDLEDYMKFFRNKDAPEIVMRSAKGVPLSTCILTLLDNIGFTGFNMKTSSSVSNDDIRIESFFSYKEDTVLEVLEKLANAAQCSMFINSVGELTVMTKERIVRSFSSASSTSSESDGTDIWFIGNSSSSGNTEHANISGYLSNIISIDEEKYLPITDGKVSYTLFDIEKQQFSDMDEIQKLLRSKRKDSNDPENAAAVAKAFNTYQYKNKKLWSITEDDNSSDNVLGYSILEQTIGSLNISAISSSVIAFDEDDAVRKIYNNATVEQRKSMRITLSQNVDEHGIYTFSNYSGYVRINSEVIRYNGKLYDIASQNSIVASRIFFSESELKQYVQATGITKPIIIPKALIVDVDFKVVSASGSQYRFDVIGDGRGALGTTRRQHLASTEITRVNNTDKFSFYLGNTPSTRKPLCDVSLDYQNTFIGKRKGNFPRGYIKLSGPADSTITTVVPDPKDPTDLDAYIFSKSERWITGYNLAYDNAVRKVGFPHVIETKMSIIEESTKSKIAGICIGFDRRTSLKYGTGIYIEFDGRPSTTLHNMRAYTIGSGRNSKSSKASTVENMLATCQIVFKTKQKTNISQEVPSNENDGIVTDFKVRIVIRKYSNSKYYYFVYWENKLVMQFIAPKPSNKNIGFFVRGDSVATYDYINVESISTGNGGSKRYFDDFGTAVREIQEFNPRWENIALSTLLIAPDRTDDRYAVYNNPRTNLMTLEKQRYAPNFNYYGGRFYLENTSNSAIKLEELPIYITGITLDVVDEGEVSVSSFLDSFDSDAKKMSSLYINRNLYDDKSFEIQSEFIQSTGAAKNMMRWILRYGTMQRLGFSLSIFPTPIIELGDKAKLFYSQKGYNVNNSVFGDKYFIVNGISYSIDENGPNMTADIIEVNRSGIFY